jgi:hypothetical protein
VHKDIIGGEKKTGRVGIRDPKGRRRETGVGRLLWENGAVGRCREENASLAKDAQMRKNRI